MVKIYNGCSTTQLLASNNFTVARSWMRSRPKHARLLKAKENLLWHPMISVARSWVGCGPEHPKLLRARENLLWLPSNPATGIQGCHCY